MSSAIVDVEAAMFGSRGGGRPAETPPLRSKTVEDRLFYRDWQLSFENGKLVARSGS